jgi:hypothetical protein
LLKGGQEGFKENVLTIMRPLIILILGPEFFFTGFKTLLSEPGVPECKRSPKE